MGRQRKKQMMRSLLSARKVRCPRSRSLSCHDVLPWTVWEAHEEHSSNIACFKTICNKPHFESDPSSSIVRGSSIYKRGSSGCSGARPFSRIACGLLLTGCVSAGACEGGASDEKRGQGQVQGHFVTPQLITPNLVCMDQDMKENSLAVSPGVAKAPELLPLLIPSVRIPTATLSVQDPANCQNTSLHHTFHP